MCLGLDATVLVSNTHYQQSLRARRVAKSTAERLRITQHTDAGSPCVQDLQLGAGSGCAAAERSCPAMEPPLQIAPPAQATPQQVTGGQALHWLCTAAIDNRG